MLSTIQIGIQNLVRAITMTLSDLPSLSSFHISNNTLSAVTEMTARNLPILNEIEIVGNALNSLLYFNYTGITEGLYNQFCGNEIQCVEL